MSEVKRLGEKYLQHMINLRETIHMYPEDGFSEFTTSKIIIEELEKLGIKVQKNVAKTGVVGLIEGKYPGKTVLLRADMDALKIQEQADVEYKSKIDGMMHACGHDGHVAGLLGAAMILNELKDNLHGNVKLVFQPAEERDGGALPMIEEGVLENPKVDAAFAAHLWGYLNEGEVHLKEGPMMASPDIFNIKVIGKGGHGAVPQESIDPIVITCQIVNSLQTIVSRKINPLDPVVITCGRIQGGDCHNVIPNEVELEGTIRTFNEETRNWVPKVMEDLIRGITTSQGAAYEFKYEPKYPALINDKDMTSFAKESLKKVVGEENVFDLKEPNMGGEDFAYFAQKVPSAFIFVGIANNKSEPVIHHNPYFKWDSKNVGILAQSLSQIAIDYLK
ncbi:MAG: amidohydrolase [Romboutsia timonensis]|uniref:M20 metallopeptidase family protein n=1 Tax=Romboutsia timonensis TaxID=1776391 RepID=UPI002A750EE0|nr:amidohydrolase [Romboutsia timonensis]MDY2882386.1 amidohydrolase [Romboutsia timonensis]